MCLPPALNLPFLLFLCPHGLGGSFESGDSLLGPLKNCLAPRTTNLQQLRFQKAIQYDFNDMSHSLHGLMGQVFSGEKGVRFLTVFGSSVKYDKRRDLLWPSASRQ